MSKILTQLLITAVALLLGSYLLPGIDVDGFWNALLVALALALLNQFVKPLLIILTIPATILTLGLFLLVVNAVVILLADWMVMGFEVDGLLWALVFSLILSIIKTLLNTILGQGGDKSSKERLND